MAGTILPQKEILEVRKVCDEFGLILHLDGARIWNVHAATGMSLAELTAPFDTISVCLSKGLGAPVGSMIVGSKEFIAKCLRERKLFGGAMRQVGIIAAAGLYAVKNNIARLVEDHANAKMLAKGLSQFKSFTVDMSRVETNIVVVQVTTPENSDVICARMKEVNVLAIPFGPRKIRFVTHLDVTTGDCMEALERVKKVVG